MAHIRSDRSLAIFGLADALPALAAMRSRMRRPLVFATLPPRLLAIWNERPDLQHGFDLRTVAGREGLFTWYWFHGYREFGLSHDPTSAALGRYLNAPLPRLPRRGVLPITWLMAKMRVRAGMSFASIKSREGQDDLLGWYFANGLSHYRLDDCLTAEQATALLAPSPDGGGTALLLKMIWRQDASLVSRFSSADDPAFERWCRQEGARDFPILAHPLIGIASPARRVPVRPASISVNLIGYGRGRSGIGEDMRMAARALEAAGVPFVMHNLVAPNHDEEFGSDSPAPVSQALPHGINLFCMPAMAMMTAVVADRDLISSQRYNIGMWPWELPEWPAFLTHAYRLVDEIWASSRFTYNAYCRSSPVAVHPMPMAVSVEAASPHQTGRAALGLPPQGFLFLTSFDGLSSFARKNPLASIAAFQQAFPDDTHDVGLIIKGLRVEGHPAWAAIAQMAQEDRRIILRTHSLSRDALLALYGQADALLSLHRSEGFGRNIAEMMLLGKPVIVSAHSGNMDFTDHANAALVPVRLRQLHPGEYPFGQGQYWAEPVIPEAARIMRQIVKQPTFRARIAAQGQTTIETRYDAAAVGARWKARLTAIHASLQDGR